MTPGADLDSSAAHRAQLEAADQNVELFAREAVLALDQFERSYPPGDRDAPRLVGERFAYLWQQYELDQVNFGSDSSDPERILTAAAKVATEPYSDGLSVQRATHQAHLDAREAGARPLTENVARLRSDLTESFGDALSLPQPGDWLQQSLSRLAKASVLRDAVRLGTKAQTGEQTQEAVNQFVQHGQQLMDNRRAVSAGASALDGDRQNFIRRQVSRAMTNFAYTVGVDVQHLPSWAALALKVPVACYLLARSMADWRERAALKDTVATGQQQLRSVRSDLAGSLDKPNSLGSRDTRAVLDARRRDGGGRGRGR